MIRYDSYARNSLSPVHDQTLAPVMQSTVSPSEDLFPNIDQLFNCVFNFFHRMECEPSLVEEHAPASPCQKRGLRDQQFLAFLESRLDDKVKEIQRKAEELLVNSHCTLSIRMNFTSKTSISI